RTASSDVRPSARHVYFVVVITGHGHLHTPVAVEVDAVEGPIAPRRPPPGCALVVGAFDPLQSLAHRAHLTPLTQCGPPPRRDDGPTVALRKGQAVDLVGGRDQRGSQCGTPTVRSGSAAEFAAFNSYQHPQRCDLRVCRTANAA